MNRQPRAYIFVILAILLISRGAGAVPGGLDPSFGNDGKVLTLFRSSYAGGEVVALQPDGKILVGGLVGYWMIYYSFGLWRFNPDGSPDLSFGDNGVVADNPFGVSLMVADIALQPDGKILMAGWEEFPSDFWLVRFNSDGSRDTSFGRSGLVSTGFYGGSDDRLYTIAVQEDGTIVGVGSVKKFNGDWEFVLVRYLSDGSLDPSFGGGDGKASTISGANDIALQPDGKIVVIGNRNFAELSLGRHDSQGRPDPSFGEDGEVYPKLYSFPAYPTSVALQPDGKILMGGVAFPNSANGDFAVWRFLPDGRLDTDFGVDGRAFTDLSGHDSAESIVLQPDGGIVAAGHVRANVYEFGDSPDFAIARFHGDGTLDTAFGTSGWVVTDFFGYADDARDVVSLPDGRIVAVGRVTNKQGFPNRTYLGLVRYLGPEQASASADLSLAKAATNAAPVTGQNLSYTLTVTNHGPDAAEAVTVVDDLPAEVLFASCSAAGGTCGGSGQHRTVSFPSLPSGSSAVVTLQTTVSCAIANGTPIHNSAQAGSATPDPHPGDESGSVTVMAVNPPPRIEEARASRDLLWPPNHKMVDVLVPYNVTDNCDAPTAIRCALSVSSNEPITGIEDVTSPDWQILNEHQVRLRAERSARGNGRVYTITITCTDTAGASSQREVVVQVPKSQGKG